MMNNKSFHEATFLKKKNAGVSERSQGTDAGKPHTRSSQNPSLEPGPAIFI